MAIAVLIPITFGMPPSTALILMGALYTGALYGGAYPAILLNTPGTPSAIATTFDGYAMTRKGKGSFAISIACFSSVIGGLIGALFLLYLSPKLASIALMFGSVEYFWLSMLGLMLIASLSKHNLLKGLIGAALGLCLSFIGVAPISADVRFTFGSQTLISGVEIVSAIIGLYCIPVLIDLIYKQQNQKAVQTSAMYFVQGFKLTIKNWFGLIKGAIIGTVVGILPGAGGSIASLVSYAEAKRSSKQKANFGSGEPRGVQATESANSATVGGGFIPTLVLGIPGTPPDAVILGALLIQGIRTGPELFSDDNGIFYIFTYGLILATLLMLPVGMFIGRYAFKAVSSISKTILVPSICLLSIVGTYSIRNSISDIYIMLILGILAYFFNQYKYEISAIVLGLILGPIAEQAFVQSYTIAYAMEDIWGVFTEGYINKILISLIVVILSAKILRFLLHKFKSQSQNHSFQPYKNDLYLAIIIFALAGIFYYSTFAMVDMDSYIFPRFILIVLMCLNTVLFINALIYAKTYMRLNLRFNQIGLLFILFASTVLLKPLGFLAATFLMFVSVMFLAGCRLAKCWQNLLIAILVIGVVYLVFKVFLLVPLP